MGSTRIKSRIPLAGHFAVAGGMTGAEGEGEEQYTYAAGKHYCSATAKVTGKGQTCPADAIGVELTAGAELPAKRGNICLSIQRAVVNMLQKKYPGCTIQAVGSCNGC